MMVGGGQGQRGVTNGPIGDPVGGGGSGSPILGAARDLSLALSTDQQQLIITLTPNDLSIVTTGADYNIYWLNPAIFSQNDVYGQTQAGISGNGTSILQGRAFVTTLSSGSGPISTTVSYGTGGAAGYSTGGWMYATVVPPGSTKEYRLSGTNYVSVPVIGANGQPSITQIPLELTFNYTALAGRRRRLAFGWRNAADLSTVAYIKIGASNYNDTNGVAANGHFQEFTTYRINTPPGARQGQTNGLIQGTGHTIILDEDNSLGAHQINWYFIPMTPAMVELPIASCPFVNTGAIT